MELTDLLKSFTRTIMLGAALYSCGGEESSQGCQRDTDCYAPRVCVRGYCEDRNGGNGDNSNNDNNRDNDDKNQGNNQGNNLSPPLGKIVFASDRDTYQGDQRGLAEIYSINADGSNLRRLTNNSVVDAFPDWSPDGEKIVFTSHRDGDSEIYVMNADGSNQTNLTQSRYQDDEPRWSPEGRKIAFMSWREHGNYSIYVMNSDGSNQQNLISEQGEYSRPAWSPDGEQIVFEGNTTSIYSELYKMNRDGSNRQQLTFGAQEQYASSRPGWFPGQKIVFNSSEKQGGTYTINPDGSGRQRIIDSYGNDFPCWSPDGNYLAFTHGPARIMIIPAEGGEERELISGGRTNYGPSWGL